MNFARVVHKSRIDSYVTNRMPDHHVQHPTGRVLGWQRQQPVGRYDTARTQTGL